MMPTLVFRFDALTDEERADITNEFKEMLENIDKAMVQAEDRTANQLRYAVLHSVREKLNQLIRLEKIDEQTYHIHLETEELRAFDVQLPIKGKLTTAAMLAEVIKNNFAWDLNPDVSYQ